MLDGPTGPPFPASTTLSGLTIDVSASNSMARDGTIYQPDYNLLAVQLGTPDAPVTIEATADGGQTSSSIIDFTTLDGSLAVQDGQTLVVASAFDDLDQRTVTINGDVSVAKGAHLAFDTGFLSDYVIVPTTDLVFNGKVSVDGGSLSLYSASFTGTGSIEISNGGVVSTPLLLNSHGVSDLPIDFGKGGGTLDFSGVFADYTGTITGFGTGDSILGNGINFGGDPLVAHYANDVLTITDPGRPTQSVTFAIAGDYTSANFNVQDNPNGIEFEISYTPCFASGTSIATMDGDVAVERLAVGQAIRLHGRGSACITWIGHRRQHGGKVVRVRAGTLGPGAPRRDLILSADHGLYLDGVLVPAGLLADGETIVTEHRDEVTFWHVELDRHATLLAEGAPAESYLDTGNRRQFANCALTYDPAASAVQDPCAEMVFAGRRPDDVRRTLRRAEAAV